MNIASILALGLFLGIRHAMDADHVIAVATIITRHKRIRAASLIGLLWGIGHSVTIVSVGVAVIVFHVVIPVTMSDFFEFLVGLTLVVLGIGNLTGILQKIIRILSDHGIHAHVHVHDHEPHVHVHQHQMMAEKPLGRAQKISTFIHQYGLFQLIRPLIVGFIHGLAGSGAMVILILGTISDPVLGVIYLFIFGMGTLVGMAAITTLIGIPIMRSAKKYANIDRWISVCSGVLSIAFGLYVMGKI